MLADNTHPAAVLLLDFYLRVQFARYFQGINIHGRPESLEVLNERAGPPLVFYSNHQSWWDGFFLFRLGRTYGLDLRVMMEEKNLRRYPFFRLTGAFGVNPGSPAGRGASLLHAIRYLRKPGKQRRALIIFPHGRLLPPWTDPWPPFKPGLETLLRLCPQARPVPVVHEIVPGDGKRPCVWMEVGAAQPATSTLTELEAALAETRRCLRQRAEQANECRMRECQGEAERACDNF